MGMRPRAYSGQLLVCLTDADFGVPSSLHLFRGEGGTDSSETDDDRSASPLMCTYLPIGELCHSGDLCSKSLTRYHFHHLQHSLFQHLRQRLPARGDKVRPCYLSSQSSLQGKTGNLSLGGVREHHLFFFHCAITLRRKDYTVLLWMTLFTSAFRALAVLRLLGFKSKDDAVCEKGDSWNQDRKCSCFSLIYALLDSF